MQSSCSYYTVNSAALLGNQVYGPYGNQRYTSGTLGTNKGFTGQYSDTLTGLDYYNARYYDPVVGVFLSADTVQGNTKGMNPYGYVGGNPETKNDPTGRKVMCPDPSGCGGNGDPTPNPSTGHGTGKGPLGGPCDANPDDCRSGGTPPPPQVGHPGSASGGFPPDARWQYKNKDVYPKYQAWMSYLEYDRTSGWHVNFHFQPVGGGEDYHNYHITFVSNLDQFIWKVFDSVTGVEKYYTWYWKSCGCEGQDMLKENLLVAAEHAALEFDGDIIGNSEINTAIHDPALFIPAYEPINEAFIELANKSLDL
jgi:RHS repeat-associated protein